MTEQTLGETSLKRVTNHNDLVVGDKYLYTETDDYQLENFSRSIDNIPTKALCKKELIYKRFYEADKGPGLEYFYVFEIIKDTPKKCDRGKQSSVGQTIEFTDYDIYRNNAMRLYHSVEYDITRRAALKNLPIPTDVQRETSEYFVKKGGKKSTKSKKYRTKRYKTKIRMSKRRQTLKRSKYNR